MMPPPTEDITITDVSNYIDKIWKDVKCECCGEAAWGLAGEPPDITYTMPFYKNGNIFDISNIRVHYSFVIICTKCGNMKFIYKPIIEQWVHTNPTQASQ